MLLPKAPIQRRAFSPREIAAQLGRDRASVYRWLASGELRPIAVSGRLMISDRELERFLGSNKGEKVKTRKRSKPQRQGVGA
jgi:excisionase family DNA binding protein